MFEIELNPFKRAVFSLATLLSAAMAIFFGVLAAVTFGKLPIWGPLMFAAGALFAAAFAVVYGASALTGRLRRKTHPPAAAGLAWGVVVTISTLSLLAAPSLPDPVVGNHMVLTSLTFLVLGAVFLLASKAEQSELRMQEKLLEIEYRLAELAERVGPVKS